MEGAEEELERRSRFLSGLIQKKKACEQEEQLQRLNVRVRASDMPHALQSRAFSCARDSLDAMTKLDSKRLALALKKASPQPSLHLLLSLLIIIKKKSHLISSHLLFVGRNMGLSSISVILQSNGEIAIEIVMFFFLYYCLGK